MMATLPLDPAVEAAETVQLGAETYQRNRTHKGSENS